MTKKTEFQSICVVGLGYIGLPTASMFATNGIRVHGVDSNPAVIATLREGRIHIEEPGLATVVKAAIASKNLTVSDAPQAADVFIVAVPTPYHHDLAHPHTADMSFVKNAMTSILPFLKKGNLVILESTSPAGTTRDIVCPMVERAGLKPGADVGVAYCPERVIPGQALKELIGNDRVIGAINEEWGQRAKGLYRAFVGGEIFLTDPTTAEMVKLLENTYRDVNIALANEVAILCEKLGVNAWDVISIANRHPRVDVHKPGPGVGGHCISVDPWFLVEKFPEEARLIRMARETNDRIPARVAEMIAALLPATGPKKVAILGLAYKANVDDDRESPSIAVVNVLKEKYPDVTLSLYDPHVKSMAYPTQPIQDVFRDANLAVVLTAHDEIRFLDPAEVGPLMRTKAVLDTHNALKSERWMLAGFALHTLGTASVRPSRTRVS